MTHKHRYLPFPEAMGGRCHCGVVAFYNIFGRAEYNPKTGTTTQLTGITSAREAAKR